MGFVCPGPIRASLYALPCAQIAVALRPETWPTPSAYAPSSRCCNRRFVRSKVAPHIWNTFDAPSASLERFEGVVSGTGRDPLAYAALSVVSAAVSFWTMMVGRSFLAVAWRRLRRWDRAALPNGGLFLLAPAQALA